MARTPSGIAIPQASPPPAEPEVEDTVYTEIWATVALYKPDEANIGDGESDQDYFKRMSQAIADVTEPDADGNSEAWSAMSEEAKIWYDSTVTAAQAGKEYPAPPGYYAESEESEPEAEETGEAEETVEAEEVTESEPEPAPQAKSGRDALIEFNAKRKAEKAAAAANGSTPLRAPLRAPLAAPVAAPVAAPGRRMTPVVAPVAPAAVRRTPTLPAARMPVRAAPVRAPVRGAAPAPTRAPAPAPMAARKRAASPVEKPKSGVELIRELIITNPDVSADQIIDYMIETHQVEPKKTTVISLLTSTRTTMNTIKNLGHWKD